MAFPAVRQARQTANPEPIMAINTTPLIDVMLVLLIMFIITIPIQSHSVKLDLPSGVPPTIRPDPIINRLTITARGGLIWNGENVTRADLRGLLAETARMEPEPELHLRPDAQAPYASVDEVLVLSGRAQVKKLGFVGNEAYSIF